MEEPEAQAEAKVALPPKQEQLQQPVHDSSVLPQEQLALPVQDVSGASESENVALDQLVHAETVDAQYCKRELARAEARGKACARVHGLSNAEWQHAHRQKLNYIGRS